MAHQGNQVTSGSPGSVNYVERGQIVTSRLGLVQV